MSIIRSTFLLGALVVGILLTGCAAEATPQTPSAPTDAEVEPLAASPSTEAEPTESQAQDPADPSTWMVTAEGLGPILLGTDVAAYAAVGPYGEVPSDCPNPAVHVLEGEGFGQILIVTGDDLSAVREVTVTAWIPTAGVPSPKTAAGIGLGASVADVKAAYAGITAGGKYGDQYAVQDGSGWVIFVIKDDVVVGVASSQTSILPSEYCG